jgi:hypothetical protein
LADEKVHATKVVLWETDEAFAEASIDGVTQASGTCGK